MNKKKILLVTLLAALLIPSLLFGAEYKGTIQGFLCVTSGVTCPVGKEDIVAAAENVFVIYEGPEKFYVITNINVKVLARNINQQAMIKGELTSSYSIKADELFIMRGGKWEKAWDVDLLSDFYTNILGSHPLKRGQ